jgi:hypothetical protein
MGVRFLRSANMRWRKYCRITNALPADLESDDSGDRSKNGEEDGAARVHFYEESILDLVSEHWNNISLSKMIQKRWSPS